MNWIRQHPECGFEDLTLEQALNDHEPSIYLVPAFDLMDDFWDWLPLFYPQIYFTEMENWCPDIKLWPKKMDGITYQHFREFFTVRFTSSVFDMEDSRLRKTKV